MKPKYHIQFQANKSMERYLGEWDTIGRIMFDSMQEALIYYDNMSLFQKENSKIVEIK